MSSASLHIWLWVVVSVAVTAVLTRLVLRMNPRFASFLFALFPVVTTPLWIANSPDASLFTFIKVWSASLGAAYILSLKFTRWAERPAGRAVTFALLAINIAEAVIAEAAQGGYVNALVGVALLATQTLPSHIRIDRESPRRDFVYPLDALWVAVYVVWNFAFVYGRVSHGERAVFAALAIIHLVAPLLAMRGRSDLFIESRAIALTIAVGLRMCWPYPPFFYRSEGWFVPEIERALCAVGAVMAIGLLGQSIAKARREPSPTDGLGWVMGAFAPARRR